MTTYILLDGNLVEVQRLPRPRAFPAIISDHMSATMHPADGRQYESKSEFRRITREHGLVEIGNDAPIGRPEFKPEGVREDIERSVQMLNQGYQPEPDGDAAMLDGAPIDTRLIG